MTAVFVGAALTIGVLVTVALYGVARGPTVPDRLVGTALATVNSVVLLAVLGFVFERVELFVDIALAYALLAFLFPVALAKHLHREADMDATDGSDERADGDADSGDGEGAR